MIESQKAPASHVGFVEDELPQDDEDFEFLFVRFHDNNPQKN